MFICLPDLFVTDSSMSDLRPSTQSPSVSRKGLIGDGRILFALMLKQYDYLYNAVKILALPSSSLPFQKRLYLSKVEVAAVYLGKFPNTTR